jgi:hypothetical protein
MRRFILASLLAALTFSFLPWASRAEASVLVEVHRGSQTMAVIVDGVHRYTWRVSTGRPGLWDAGGRLPSTDDGGALVVAHLL